MVDAHRYYLKTTLLTILAVGLAMLPTQRPNPLSRRTHLVSADLRQDHSTTAIQETTQCQLRGYDPTRSTLWRLGAHREGRSQMSGHHTSGTIEIVPASDEVSSLLPAWTMKLWGKPQIEETCRSCFSLLASSFLLVRCQLSL